MAIKVIEALPGDDKKDNRMEQLKVDLREIIMRKVPLCEIIDPQYPDGTIRDRLIKAIRTVIWEFAERDKNGVKRIPKFNGVLEIKSRKGQERRHWYIQFDVKQWEAEWENFWEENR